MKVSSPRKYKGIFQFRPKFSHEEPPNIAWPSPVGQNAQFHYHNLYISLNMLYTWRLLVFKKHISSSIYSCDRFSHLLFIGRSCLFCVKSLIVQLMIQPWPPHVVLQYPFIGARGLLHTTIYWYIVATCQNCFGYIGSRASVYQLFIQ